jgi:hypothetical protein
MIMEERWVDLDDFPNHQVSTHGKVRNKKTGKHLKPFPDRYGYNRLSIGNTDNVYIHRLVAKAFYGTEEGRPQVHHRDNNRKNNHVLNLMYCTASENIKWSVNDGKNAHLRASERARVVNMKPVRIVENGMVFDSILSCAKHLNISASNVSRHLRGRRPSVGGVHVEFLKGGERS